MTSGPSLRDLPRELYGEIGSHLEGMGRFPEVSKGFYTGTKHTYFNKLCREDLRLSEIKKYLETEPDRFGLLQIRVRPLWLPLFEHVLTTHVYHFRYAAYMYTSNRSVSSFTPPSNLTYYGYDYDHELQDLEDITTTVLEDITKSLKSFQEHKSIASWPDPQIDLFSIREILKRRLGCVTRDPTYAKKRTHEILDAFYNWYLQERSSQTIFNILIMHDYVKMNAHVLGLDYYSLFNESMIGYMFSEDGTFVNATDDTTSEDFDRIVDRMQREIDETVPLLHNAIDQLN